MKALVSFLTIKGNDASFKTGRSAGTRMLMLAVSILTPEIEYQGVRALDPPDPPAGGRDALPSELQTGIIIAREYTFIANDGP